MRFRPRLFFAFLTPKLRRQKRRKQPILFFGMSKRKITTTSTEPKTKRAKNSEDNEFSTLGSLLDDLDQLGTCFNNLRMIFNRLNGALKNPKINDMTLFDSILGSYVLHGGGKLNNPPVKPQLYDLLIYVLLDGRDNIDLSKITTEKGIKPRVMKWECEKSGVTYHWPILSLKNSPDFQTYKTLAEKIPQTLPDDLRIRVEEDIQAFWDAKKMLSKAHQSLQNHWIKPFHYGELVIRIEEIPPRRDFTVQSIYSYGARYSTFVVRHERDHLKTYGIREQLLEEIAAIETRCIETFKKIPGTH